MLLILFSTALDNANWPLKPLFFEVPSPSSTSFVGRKWLFREVLEHLSSDLPTSGGMIIQGAQATGKSSIILRLVQGSSFGHQGKFSTNSVANCTSFSKKKSKFKKVTLWKFQDFSVTQKSIFENLECLKQAFLLFLRL